MPDKKLTDTEIKKALEESISFDEPYESDFTLIRIEHIKNALDLINRLEAENEKLNKELKNSTTVIKNLTSENRNLTSYLVSANAEVDRLKQDLKITMKNYVESGKTIKAEAYKEFVERLSDKVFKINYCGSVYNVVDKDDIDNLH